MSHSPIDQQNVSSSPSKSSSRLEKVCGRRTQEAWGTEEGWFYDFPAFCVLWDSSCSGNESYAKDRLGLYGWMIRLDVCFGDPSCQCLINGKPIPEASASSYASLLSYVRAPECAPVASQPPAYCCARQDECQFGPTFVEIYYWPAEDADTSCLSIIGDSINPWDYGATLTTTTEWGAWPGRPMNWNRIGTYWGCESSLQIFTTAVMTSINGFTFKSSMYNPWGTNNPCTDTSSTIEALASNSSVLSALQIRPRSLPRPVDSVVNTTRPPLSEATLDGHTFTYPSVYVNFIGLEAWDDCGPIRTANSMYTTMIAFDEDELSTVEGGGYVYWNMQTTKPFNFADLPCPPQSVMAANWYKPAPGEPYVPRLAFPSQLKALDPHWSNCEAVFFTAYDPPRTLVPVSAIGPDTTVDPSSTTRDSSYEGSTPAPESTPELHQPERTPTPLGAPGVWNEQSSLREPTPTPKSSSVDGVGVPAGTSQTAHPGTVKTASSINDLANSLHNGATHTLPVFPDGQPSIVTTIAGDPATLLPGIITVSGETLGTGDPPITISGTMISLGPTALTIAATTLPLPQSQQILTTVAGNVVTFIPNAVAIAGTTLTPGGLPTTFSGTAISLDSSALFVAPTPLPLPQSQSVVSDIAGSRATLLPNAVEIAGKTLRPGDSPFTLLGTVMSVDSAFLSIGTRTIFFAQSLTTGNAVAPTTAIVGGHGQNIDIISSDSFIHGTPVALGMNGELIIGDTTLRPEGAAASIDGRPVSLAPDANLVLDGTTLRPGAVGTRIHGTVLSIAANGELVIDETTLKPGGAAMTIGGASTFLSSDGDIVLDGNTLKPGSTAMTIHGLTISLGLNGDLIIDGTHLTPGAAGKSIAGIPVSLAPDGDIVIDGTTLSQEDSSQMTAISDEDSIIAFSTASNGDIVIDGTTLSQEDAGQLAALSVDGSIIAFSTAPDGDIVIDGTTLSREDADQMTVISDGDSITASSTAPTDGLGALIIGGFRAGPTGSLTPDNFSSPSLAAFEGAAARPIFGLPEIPIMLMVILIVVRIS